MSIWANKKTFQTAGSCFEVPVCLKGSESNKLPLMRYLYSTVNPAEVPESIRCSSSSSLLHTSDCLLHIFHESAVLLASELVEYIDATDRWITEEQENTLEEFRKKTKVLMELFEDNNK